MVAILLSKRQKKPAWQSHAFTMCLPPVKFSLGSFRVFYSTAVV